MKVADALNKDIAKIKRSLSLREFLNKFKHFHAQIFIPVVGDNDLLLGVIYPESLLDLLRPQQAKLFRNIPFMEIDETMFDLAPVPSMGELIIAEDIMNTDFVTVEENIPLQDAYKTMRLHKKECLPVINKEGKIVGILGIFDIIWRMFKEKEIV